MKKSNLATNPKHATNEATARDLGLHDRLYVQLLDQKPELTLDVLDQLIALDGDESADGGQIERLAFRFAHGLEIIRYGVERKNKKETKLADDVRKQLLRGHARGAISSEMLLFLLNQFVTAKLDVGDALREAAREAVEAIGAGAESDGIDAEGLTGMLSELGDDSFAIAEMLGQIVEAMPADTQVALATSMLSEAEPLANAALAFLQSATPDVRQGLGQVLTDVAANSKLARPLGLRRLTQLRQWRPAPEQAAIDAAITAIRAQGVAPAPTAPAPAKTEFHASGFDGSGMQGIFAVIPDGKKLKVGSVIGRFSMGVRDAWVRPDMTRRDVKDMLEMTSESISLKPTSAAYVTKALRQFIAANAASGMMPPFGLLAFAEAVGISDLGPLALTPEDVVAELVSDIEPSRLTPAAVARVVTDSSDWTMKHEHFDSWFEDEEDLVALVGKKGDIAKKVQLLLSGRLERNRRRWAEILAWSALTARQDKTATDWQDFAILARELLSKRPLADIGLMHQVARNTIDVAIKKGSGLVFM